MAPTAPISTPSSAAPKAPPQAWRVEVFRRPQVDDPAGAAAVAALREVGIGGVRSIRRGQGYLLSPELGADALARVASQLLLDPVLETARITAPGQWPEPANAAAAREGARRQRILVMRRRGVMDPTALTIEQVLQRSALSGAAVVRVLTFVVWELEPLGAGPLERAVLERAAREVFANDVVDEYFVDDEALHFDFPAPSAPRVVQHVPLRDADERELERLSRDGQLSLSLDEMLAIQAHYRARGAEPTLAELETLAQTWSEHCKHKTFTGVIDYDGERIDNLLKQTIKAATLELNKPWCVSVFHDNAGVIEFDQGWNVCFKVETHNHPSAIDPYGGAGTGVGGVIRDILGVGLGAKPIANTDAFFVGPADLPAEKLPKGCMHPRRILRGVVAGVRDYGNRMGIPTVNGGVWFHPRYIGNPLVYAGCVGLMPADCTNKSVEPGDAIVVVGGRTGRDGIHGATFSSLELHDESQVVSSSAVQIGDPITEKRVTDALLRARDARQYRAVTDCGAGGLSSAVGEMGAECGAEVDLELVPLKYPGLSPAEIWISEAQERMVLAVPQEKLAALLATFRAEGCEATAIGRFTATGRLDLRYRGELVGSLEMHFLHEGNPRPLRRATRPVIDTSDPGVPACPDATAMTLALLRAPNVASKEWIVRQYDHEVQGMGVLKPLCGERDDGPGDAAVLQPLPHSQRGIAIGCGANPDYGLRDPYAMACAVIDEALRNVVAVGGDPSRTAILDNFSWGNCKKPEQLGALVEASRGCKAAALAYQTPFISGKDSLNNEFRSGDETISIPPTLYVSALAIVPDVARSVSMDFKRAGDFVYVLGMTHAEFGGSQYFAQLGLSGGRAPRPDLALAPRTLRGLHAAIARGLVRACHDLSEGGLAVAAAEMAFAGELGAALDVTSLPLGAFDAARNDRDALALFSESCTRFLVEVAPESAAEFERTLAGLDWARIGAVNSASRLTITRGAVTLVDAQLQALRAAHQGGFKG
ncbi:MAG: phosphoribosylformylglycinamidine synthase subunit PurL [Planctomycetes bacterium]|nr:phosphoribosylformylglycinamidine synthase subunit PurL [Planctomycetota bacterium]